jgi:hypothetical protein
MAARKKSEAKAVVPQRENKAVRPAYANKKAPGYLRVRVVKAHDGIEAGAVFSKPERVAKEMINLGYWEAV